MSDSNLQINTVALDGTPWVPLVVAGRKAFRRPIPSDVLVLLPTSTSLDLMQDPTVLWICKNLRAVLGERQFAVEAVLHSQPFRGHELVEDLSKQKRRIGNLFRTYRPKVVLVVGPELIRILKPTVATRSNANIVGYVHPLEFGDKAVAVCVPYLHDRQYVLRNIDEISVDFAKVPFMLDNPNAHKEGTIIKLDTDKSANEYIDFLLNDHKGYLAYDTETRNRNKRYHNRLASMQFATDTETSYVLYWNHDYNNRSREHDKLVLRPKLRKIFGGYSKIAGLIAHYAVFDISSTRMEFDIDYWGIRTYDTVLITHLLDQNRQRDDRITKPLPGAKPHELKQLVNEFFAYDGYEAETKAARKDGSLIDLPEPRLTKYAGQDGFAEYRIFKFLLHWAKTLGRLDDIMRFSNTVHARAIRTFQNMSYNGMLVDLDYIEALERPDSIINREIQSVKDKFKSDPVAIRVNEALLRKKTNASHFWQIPWVFDIAKPASKFMLFYDKEVGLGLEPLPDPKKPEEKPKSSCDDHFQQHYAKIPQVKWLTEFSEVEKLRNTYVSKMGAAIRNANRDKTDLADGRVHPDYNLNGTDTGRLSCIADGSIVDVEDSNTFEWRQVEIENVKEGDRVYCYTDLGQPTTREVKWAGKTGEKRCMKLSWEGDDRNGYLYLTDDHEVNTVHHGWVPACELVEGEQIYAILPYYGIPIKQKVKLRSVEEDLIRNVYCLVVDDVHNFIANGICVKNCTKPNLQQIPRADNDFKKAVKNTFITPPGTCIVQADFCAAEVRMWGSLSQDAFLCELLTNAFNKRAAYRANPTDKKLEEDAMLMGDVHKQTASLMFGVTLKEVTKALRTVTKGITFGLIYGRGERSIAEQLDKSEQETHELCQKFFAQFPEGVAWLEEQKRFVQQHHYIETPFKRRRYLPWINDLDRKLQSSALRQSINSPVQSAAGDFATLSISLLDEELHKRRLSKHFKLTNAVHDSTLVEAPASADALAEIVPIIRQCFTIRSRDIVQNVFGFETKAPMDIDIEVSQRKAWHCTKCGHTYKYYKSKCDKTILGDDKKPLIDKNGDEIKCAHTERSLVKLNGGWGTLIALDETMSGYREAASGF